LQQESDNQKRNDTKSIDVSNVSSSVNNNNNNNKNSNSKPKRERVIEYNEFGEKVITFKNVVPNSAFDGEFDENRNKNEFQEALNQVRNQRNVNISSDPTEQNILRNKLRESTEEDYSDMPPLEEELKICKTMTDYGDSDFNFLSCVITEDFGIGDETTDMVDD